MSPKGREIRVGLVILAAMVVLAAGIFLIGSKNNLFSRKTRYYVEFNSVSGLKPGSPVQLDGVDVGAIERVVLSENPRKKDIRVWIRVEDDYTARLRGPADRKALIKDQVPSLARIKTLGLLGDKYIDINSGSPAYPPIEEEGEIPAAQPTNVDALIASGEGVMDNVVEITHSLNSILGRMERGEGLLGQLTSDSPEGRRLQTSLTGASESLQRIALTVENGKGPLPRLLNDRVMADQLARSLDRFQGLLDQAQNGPGLLPGLLNDPSSRAEFNDTLASLHKVAQDLQGFTADLESNDALVPRLVHDKEFGREVTEQLRQLLRNLNDVSAKLDRGKGTAAQLINDPKIYDAVNDIIAGVNQSKVLRWLIRNRQQKGIDKRYDDTKKAVEGSGGTPEPLDKLPEGAPAEKPPAPPPADSTAPPPPPNGS
ncbi:MAG TPA: MlaD family protein [Thermoanaerobaculia bacterium]|jgi:phospholipid/cholesterol/gamma-HCH transport system substrate-binding protein